MSKIQRWSQDVGAMFKDEEGKWCYIDDVSRLEESHKELLNQLEYMAGQHRCGCGHPHCNRCEDDRMNQEIINKVKGME